MSRAQADGPSPPGILSEATAQRPERKGERTKRRILATARRVFAEVGYERATIRAIAAAADVDKSSVIQYFGTKQRLFREAVHWRIPLRELTTGDPVQSTDNYLRAMLSSWAADPNSPMAVLLRASMTSDEAAGILRDHVTAEAVDVMADTITAAEPRLRAALAGAMMMGIAAQRYVLRMPDLADADLDDVLRVVAPAMRAIIAPDSCIGADGE
ncbi:MULTISPECIES: TetR family transcriptional regulator [unclassified Micromonospora]|uniref:TetR/AcrR family transcriptional regulator n=1 Tax=unclassified Micromonospora TaxID=2617518 RepID=UPI001C24F598|nr:MULTISPECIES: TetR family transcriptional regulator [unclassified Micromonospora]MBU8861791.1 TetR family transcriptional regulator [Micromonospora sp. WMMB482]MDG4800114.1 TetR family transcriptional regulator [Micromonospora sp. WMMD980]MDM4781372.1 TetR family transcriptional regulator [Micromonospora sp. b486]